VRALDELLPAYDVNEVHAVELPLSPEEAIERVLALPLTSDPLVRILFRLRGLRSSGTVGDVLRGTRFQELARSPLEVVVGFSGKPWLPRGDSAPFTEPGPGMVRVATDFRAEALAGGSRLSTETRIAAVDAHGLRRFRAYWLAVGPFSALIRRRWLAAVRRSARTRRGTA
jgi:hypothetical protein